MAIYLLIGVYFFGVILSVNVVGTLIVLALGIGTFVGISMIGSGILILTKQGDPVTALMTIAISLFGNVLFPPQVLPPVAANNRLRNSALLLLHMHQIHADRCNYHLYSA